MDRYFVVVNVENSPKELSVDRDIFVRPMPWGIWLKAVFGLDRGMWRFARLIGIPDLERCQLAIEDGHLVVDTEIFPIEKSSPLIVVLWAIESVYYKTSLKFWNWPMFRR